MIDFDGEVRALAVKYPTGMSVVVQLTGGIPMPPPGVEEEEVRAMLDLMERVAQKYNGAKLS
jgi:hypothetical protein